MKNIFKSFLPFLMIAFLIFISFPSKAQISLGNEDLGNLANEAGYSETTLPEMIGRIIKIILGFLGLAALIIMIVGGFMWMTSGGNPDKIGKAKKIIINGLIGLLIIVFAYAIVSFVISKFVEMSGGKEIIIEKSGPGGSLPSDAFKIRKIETAHGGLKGNYHQDVYLCSAVQPIFNSGVKSETIRDLAEANELRVSNISGSNISGTWETRSSVVIFKHPDLFAKDTSYEAFFPKAIVNTQNKNLQQCLAAGNCSETGSYFVWQFITGETTDNTPPTIVSSYPAFTKIDKNVSLKPVFEINFSEPIDLTTIADKDDYPLSENFWLAELNKDGTIVKTLTKEIFKIDANSNGNGFQIFLRDDNLLTPFAKYKIHVSGVKDLCSNSMSQAFEWEFQTNANAPGISSYYPTGDKICPDQDIIVVFGTQMYNQLVRIEFIRDKDIIFQSEMRPSETESYQTTIKDKNRNDVGVFKVSDLAPQSSDPIINNHFRTFVFNLDNNLEPETKYEVKVETDLVMNQQGDLLKGSWEFTTATLQTCLCSPWISYLDPAEGVKGQCLTIYGQCFKGTSNKPAEPVKIEFVLGQEKIEGLLGVADNNYLTTVVPDKYNAEDRPKVQTIVQYQSNEQLTSNAVEFYINSNETFEGPCLLRITPSQGYAGETEVELTGKNFGEKGQNSQVLFYNNQVANYRYWDDYVIAGALVPEKTQTGSVYIIKDDGNKSNGLPFTILLKTNGPGGVCQETNNCPDNSPYFCSSSYKCLYQDGDTCRCCCDPKNNTTCTAPLKCLPNQGSCTGEDRGLCCGCQNDDQCGNNLGCGILDPSKCCYSRPTVVSFQPTGDTVCLNTGIEIAFDKIMDTGSLNKNNIKFLELISVGEKQEEKDIDFDLSLSADKNNNTIIVIYPDNCNLNPKTTYQVKLKGGINGQGIRDAMGVSLSDYQAKFATGEANNFCQIKKVEISPIQATVKSFSEKVTYTAQAHNESDNPVCVFEFNWQSSDVNIASLSLEKGLSTVVSAVGGSGEKTADISAEIKEIKGSGKFTSVLSPPIIDSISPESGTNDPAIPTYVTIFGQNFGQEQGASVVKFGEVEAEIGCNNWSNTEIVAVVPASLSPSKSYEVAVINPTQGISNKKDFTVKNEFHPAICQLRPNKGETGTKIIIEGVNFGDQQGSGYVSFGTDSSKPQILSDLKKSWSNNKIEILAPSVPEEEAKIAVYVPSPIESGNPLKSSNLVSFYKEPIIESINPNNGPKGIWITIKGKNFGSSPGEVYFRDNGNDYQAKNLPESCSTTWTEKQIIVGVPDKLDLLSEETARQIKVYLKTEKNIQSNLFTWELNKKPLGARLCQIEPASGDIGSVAVIKGEGFDLKTGESEREVIFNPNKQATILTWDSDSKINNLTVPNGAQSGEVKVTKKIATNCRSECSKFSFAGKCFGQKVLVCDDIVIESNPLDFTITKTNPEPVIKIPLPQVIEDSSCEQTTQSPSPRHLFLQTCTNALISARFDRPVTDLSLNLKNIIVQKCNSGDKDFDSQSCTINLRGKISLEGFNGQGFVFTPVSSMEKNYWYQVILKSGADGIKDENGNYLDGNKNHLSDGSPTDDYYWHFKTNNEQGICSTESIKSIKILENLSSGEKPGIIILPDNRNYISLPIGSDCQILNPENFSWSWSSTQPEVATVAKVEQQPDNTAIATAVGLGTTEIQAKIQEKSGKIDLVVTAPPKMITSQPSGNNVCRNSAISAEFDQIIDKQTISPQTIKLIGTYQSEQKGMTCRQISSHSTSVAPNNVYYPLVQIWQKFKTAFIKKVTAATGDLWTCELPINLESQEIDGKTIIQIKINKLLDENVKYKVTIDKTLKNQYGIELTRNESWEFTAGELCLLSKVLIDPNKVLFTQAKATKQLTADAYDKQGNKIQGINEIYTWTWSWASSNPNIVSLSDSKSKSVNIAAVKNGSSQITAIATPTSGNPISASIQAEVFICDNPWIYGDPQTDIIKNTNFSLKYCRDYQPLLPELSRPEKELTRSDDELLVKEFLFIVPASNDAIGLKIMKNPKKLTPFKWYQQYMIDQGGSAGNPKSLLIDNYYAVQEGRTVYVGALNAFLSRSGSFNVDSYIYLLSYNEKASPETIEIFNQLVANWKFNTNLTDPDDKAKLQRDLLRFYDLEEIKTKLKAYKYKNGLYPILGGGTFVQGKTNSRWPSWQNTLGEIIGASLPVDPINTFNGPCAGCGENQCQNTCYNSSTREFEHPNGSHVYQYSAPEQTDCLGSYYTLKANFEFFEFSSRSTVWFGQDEKDNITISSLDQDGTANYFYSSEEAPVCDGKSLNCGEQCDGNYNKYNAPFPANMHCSDKCDGYICNSGYADCDNNPKNGCEKKAIGTSCSSNNECCSSNCLDNVCRPSDWQCSNINDGCCDLNHHFRNTSTVCRPADLSGCDKPEYCSGNSAQCPNDQKESNGKVCGYTQCYYCQGGECVAVSTVYSNNLDNLDPNNQCPDNSPLRSGYCADGQGGCEICNENYTNCDGNAGCETYLRSPQSCGTSCDDKVDCSQLPNVDVASVSCSGTGTCVISACNSGWGNCDNNVSNGCETNLNNDLNNCGSCRKQCSTVYANTESICIFGGCSWKCKTNYGNCDKNVYVNGCETYLRSPRSCGTSCDNKVDCLQLPNVASVSCSGTGTCVISACKSGWGNCDNNVSNGCETNLNNDLNNCGSCGKVCPDTFGNCGEPYCNKGCFNNKYEEGTSCGFCQICDETSECSYVEARDDPNNDCGTDDCFTGDCDGHGACAVYTDGKQHNCDECYVCNSIGVCVVPPGKCAFSDYKIETKDDGKCYCKDCIVNLSDGTCDWSSGRDMCGVNATCQKSCENCGVCQPNEVCCKGKGGTYFKKTCPIAD